MFLSGSGGNDSHFNLAAARSKSWLVDGPSWLKYTRLSSVSLFSLMLRLCFQLGHDSHYNFFLPNSSLNNQPFHTKQSELLAVSLYKKETSKFASMFTIARSI